METSPPSSLTSIPADISPLQNDLRNLVYQWFHNQQRQIKHSFNQVIEAVKTVILGRPVARLGQAEHCPGAPTQRISITIHGN